MLDVSDDRFEELVSQALGLLPPSFAEHLHKVSVVIEPESDDPQHLLFGLYEGIPLTERGIEDVLLPDRITIFRRSFLESCDTEAELVEEVRVTVLHEIGHFFGMDEDQLEELGYG
ncbi:MAG: metallopeptidase family protein [Gemmatimonadota bacterium]|nr:metallopeptidase family protein [Gemmatimonadota bacterium]